MKQLGYDVPRQGSTSTINGAQATNDANKSESNSVAYYQNMPKNKPGDRSARTQ